MAEPRILRTVRTMHTHAQDIVQAACVMELRLIANGSELDAQILRQVIESLGEHTLRLEAIIAAHTQPDAD